MSFAFVFPGQGSQSLGMMAAYGDEALIRTTFDEASQALGRDLWQLVRTGPAEALNETVNTQPVMLTADIAVWRLWRAKGGRLPAVVAGHSLGEYAALVAAEVLTLAEAVPLVQARAQAMQRAVPVGAGAMAAILGLDAGRIGQLCAEQAGDEVVEPVNFNAPEQTVIAGHKAAVERAAQACKDAGAKRAVLLPVSAPFHCRLMQPAAEALHAVLAGLTLGKPSLPVINNVDVAQPAEPEAIRAALVRQAAAPVRWVETMRAMAAMGVQRVYECGPGKVLAGLVKRCSESMSGVPLNDLAAIEVALAQEKNGD